MIQTCLQLKKQRYLNAFVYKSFQTCRHLCCTEMILKFHKWCGFNLTVNTITRSLAICYFRMKMHFTEQVRGCRKILRTFVSKHRR